MFVEISFMEKAGCNKVFEVGGIFCIFLFILFLSIFFVIAEYEKVSTNIKLLIKLNMPRD